MTREDEVALVEAILHCTVGYDLDLFGGMLVLRTTGGPTNTEETIDIEWEVMVGKTPNSGTASFAKSPGEIRAAAEFFVTKRHELRVGSDFEEQDFMTAVKRESPR